MSTSAIVNCSDSLPYRRVAARAFDCFYCLSLWLALPLAVVLGRDIVSTVVLWLGLSGGACLLERVTARAHAAVEETPTSPSSSS